MFKKGKKNNPENYRGITLLNTISKLLTKIVALKIEPILKISEEQQGFRKNRSTTDAIYIVQQVVEKAIEYKKTAYLCFIDLTKAFDLHNILEILQEKRVNNDIQILIQDLNTNIKTKIRVEVELSSEETTISSVIGKIIENVKQQPGYRLWDDHRNVLCYADDVILLAEPEDNLQRMLYKFATEAKKYNMTIATEKTKSLVISKEPIRCKLEVEGNLIELVMTYK